MRPLLLLLIGRSFFLVVEVSDPKLVRSFVLPCSIMGILGGGSGIREGDRFTVGACKGATAVAFFLFF